MYRDLLECPFANLRGSQFVADCPSDWWLMRSRKKKVLESLLGGYTCIYTRPISWMYNDGVVPTCTYFFWWENGHMECLTIRNKNGPSLEFLQRRLSAESNSAGNRPSIDPPPPSLLKNRASMFFFSIGWFILQIDKVTLKNWGEYTCTSPLTFQKFVTL